MNSAPAIPFPLWPRVESPVAFPPASRPSLYDLFPESHLQDSSGPPGNLIRLWLRVFISQGKLAVEFVELYWSRTFTGFNMCLHTLSCLCNNNRHDNPMRCVSKYPPVEVKRLNGLPVYQLVSGRARRDYLSSTAKAKSCPACENPFLQRTHFLNSQTTILIRAIYSLVLLLLLPLLF